MFLFRRIHCPRRFSHSSTNQIIANIKKKPSVRGTAQWQHKINDMRRVARAIAGALRPDHLADITFVPIPPSKAATNPEYDPRMLQIAGAISPLADVRELIVTRGDRPAAHESEQRLRPDELAQHLQIREDLVAGVRRELILIDDVITTGCSFVACRDVLRRCLPNTRVMGIFAARRVLPRTAGNEFQNLDW